MQLRVAAGDRGLVADGPVGAGRYRLVVDTDERGEPRASALLVARGAVRGSGALTLALGENELVLQVLEPASEPWLLLSDGVAVGGPEPAVPLDQLPPAPPPFSGVVHQVRHLPPRPPRPPQGAGAR